MIKNANTSQKPHLPTIFLRIYIKNILCFGLVFSTGGRQKPSAHIHNLVYIQTYSRGFNQFLQFFFKIATLSNCHNFDTTLNCVFLKKSNPSNCLHQSRLRGKRNQSHKSKMLNIPTFFCKHDR